MDFGLFAILEASWSGSLFIPWITFKSEMDPARTFGPSTLACCKGDQKEMLEHQGTDPPSLSTSMGFLCRSQNLITSLFMSDIQKEPGLEIAHVGGGGG